MPPAPAPEGHAPVDAPAAEGEESHFYWGLVDPRDPVDLQSLPGDDRIFLSGILKRLRENRLEVPVLPQAALEISRLLSDAASDAGDFARVLNADPALSVDVLRMANSAYYGFGQPVTSVRDAVVRIGLNQLRGLIIVTHLQAKVLQGGSFQREAGWLSELSTGLAQLSRGLAADLGIPPDAAFTRGILGHVEHFIIMGTVSEVSRDQRRRIQPSRDALLEAFSRFAPRVRDLAARSWSLEEFLLGAEGEVAGTLGALRTALVADWTGRGAEAVPGVAEERLQAVLGRIRAARAAA